MREEPCAVYLLSEARKREQQSRHAGGLCTGHVRACVRVLGLLSRKPGAAGGALFTSQTRCLGFRHLGPGEEGFRPRNGATAKLDWLPMNGGPEKGQW